MIGKTFRRGEDVSSFEEELRDRNKLHLGDIIFHRTPLFAFLPQARFKMFDLAQLWDPITFALPHILLDRSSLHISRVLDITRKFKNI